MDLFLVEAETGHVAGDLPALNAFRSGTRCIDDQRLKECDARSREAPVYCVRFWCKTAEGESCCVVVRDAYATFYRKLDPSTTVAASECLASELMVMAENFRGRDAISGGIKASAVQRHTTNGWIESPTEPGQPRLFSWLEIRAASPGLKTKAASILGDGIRKEFPHLFRLITPKTAERNAQVHAQVCEQQRVKPGSWFRIPTEEWERRRVPATSGVRVLTTWILSVAQECLLPVNVDALPPLRVLSYDIEVFSKDGSFPNATRACDPIITIGVHVKTLYGRDVVSADPRHAEACLAFCLYKTDDIDNGETRSFKCEKELLLAFAQYVRDSDADFLLGYNIVLFDNDYMLKRAELLMNTPGESGMLRAEKDRAFCWSRIADLPCAPWGSFIGSSALGDNKVFRCVTPGRVDLDLWFERKRANAPDLPNLKLNTVALHYLGETKHDLPPKEIFAKFRECTRNGRALIASYCIQDCVLVTRLVEKLEVLASVLSMSQITGVTPSQILWRGQGVKVMFQLCEEAHRQNYVVEDTNTKGRDEIAEEVPGGYEGATVLEPIPGFYRDPILCLDFAALYPSLIRTAGLSIETFVKDPSATTVETFRVPNTKHHFVSTNVRRGILPVILDNLTAARKAAKRMMKEAVDDPGRRSLFNFRQLAIKISANSVYGFTGCKTGQIEAVQVAESTTGFGRHVIDLTSRYVQEKYGGATTIYGDSVTGDTALVVRRAGVIETVRIDELTATWPQEEGTEKQEVHFTEPNTVEVWQDGGGFTPVRRIIRHMCAKPLVRVLTHTGTVDCTTDHSLLRSDGRTASPADVRHGDELLHADDAPLLRLLSAYSSLHGTIDAREAFAMGLFAADGSCGSYRPSSEVKHSWAINNRDTAPLSKAGEHLPFRTRILDTLKTSGVYKLVPVGNIRGPTRRYRALFYNQNREKRIPPGILAAPLVVVEAFWDGFYAGDGDRKARARQRVTRIDQRGKEMVTGLWLLGRRLGYLVSLDDRSDKNSVYRLTFSKRAESAKSTCRRSATAVKKLRDLESGAADFVYDLETQNHHFHVAPGNLVVHNTDSVFVRLPEERRHDNTEALFGLGEEMARAVTAHIATKCTTAAGTAFPSHVELEFEKMLNPLILWRKKRYSGLCFEDVDKPPKLLVKGIELVRRDALPLIKDIQEKLLHALIYRADVEEVLELVRGAVQVLLDIPVGGPFGPVVQSKSLKAEYKNGDSLPHVKVAQLMDARDPGSAPKVGDRISYVVCASSATRVVDKAEDPSYAEDCGLAVDYIQYLQSIETPILRLLEVPVGELAPAKLGELRSFFEASMGRARALHRMHVRCRVGEKGEWKRGHAAKNGGYQELMPQSWIKHTCAESAPAPPKRRAKKAQADTDALVAGGDIGTFLQMGAAVKPTAKRTADEEAEKGQSERSEGTDNAGDAQVKRPRGAASSPCP